MHIDVLHIDVLISNGSHIGDQLAISLKIIFNDRKLECLDEMML